MPSMTGDSGDFERAAIDIPASVTLVGGIVRFLLDTLVSQSRLSSNHADQITELIMRRESLGSTAVGRGIALPHTQTDLIRESIIVMGRCVRPVNWPRSLDGEPVSIVCLVISPTSPDAHAKALESVAQRLRAIQSE
jgi:PTS system fructose-specific IIA component/PTS system nitrogen regulatory IIA component